MPAIHFLLLPGVDAANFLGDLLRHFSLDEHTSRKLYTIKKIHNLLRSAFTQAEKWDLIKRMAKACIRRLLGMNDMDLVAAIATKPQDVSRQICLYAMMKEHRLISDFMLTVVGEKYRMQDMSFGRIDGDIFFLRLQ